MLTFIEYNIQLDKCIYIIDTTVPFVLLGVIDFEELLQDS